MPADSTEEPSATDARGALREVVLAFAGVSVVTWAVATFGRGTAFDGYVALTVGASFALAAIELAQRQPDGVQRYGLSLGGLFEPPTHAPVGWTASLRDLASAVRKALPLGVRETAVALGIAAVVFPPFALAFHAWHAPSRGFELRWPDEPVSYLLGQLVVIALPEEAFFRGYIQGRLGDRFGARVRMLGAELCPQAWLGQAALFGLLHALVDLDPLRMSVFFPALLFGWLRAWRGGIGAAAVLHALSNLLSDVLVRGWL